MTPRQAELIAGILHHAGWQAFLEVKQEKLDRIHQELEYEGGLNVQKLQGKVAEIREDFALQKKVLSMLAKKG